MNRTMVLTSLVAGLLGVLVLFALWENGLQVKPLTCAVIGVAAGILMSLLIRARD